MTHRQAIVRACTGITLLTLLMALVFTQRADAHGSMISPASRTYACYVDGLQPSGEIVPVNPACAAAVAVSGTQPLYDWYGVLRSDGAGRTRGFIPDGQLCSGGSPKYAGLDIPSADWPTQSLRAGSDYDFTYAAWVPHPGSFRLYITKQGYDPTKPLNWDDLESAPFLTADPEPPLTDGAYHLHGHLPDGLTGRHVIYSVWQRSDSTETFYNCSDVLLGDDETTPPPPPPPADCSASVVVEKSWQGGFQASVSVTDNGSRKMTDWAVQWTMPDGAKVSDGWNGTFMQTGSTVMVHAPDWHKILNPGETATAGFNGSSDQVPQFTSVRCS